MLFWVAPRYRGCDYRTCYLNDRTYPEEATTTTRYTHDEDEKKSWG